mgnify:CR=1 FL=1
MLEAISLSALLSLGVGWIAWCAHEGGQAFAQKQDAKRRGKTIRDRWGLLS